MMKHHYLLVTFLATVCIIRTALAENADPFKPQTAPSAVGEYALIIEGYDWGPAVSRVVLAMDETVTEADYRDYSVQVKRMTDCTELPDEQAMGSRRVIHAYVSDSEGNVSEEGEHLTLVMEVSPNNPLDSPIQYTRNDKCRGNNWLTYRMNVLNQNTLQSWHTETDRIMPVIDRFDMSGIFKHEDQTLTYASFVPENHESKRPLIIWLHGGGEGGTDPSIPLVANKAANYASDEIQAIFGGAYVLSPQTPTYWMDNGEGGMTRGQTEDAYHEALIALIRNFVDAHPQIDEDRIYLGGCSNGGYMTLKLLLEHPDYFAAAFPSALAYHSEYLSDEEIKSIRHIPIWFVHAKDDPVTVAKDTAIPVYERLKAAKAKNVHMSLYDHVVDITGFFGGDDYHYNGHWSWIYSHANHCRRDADGSLVMLEGRPTTIMEWLAVQSR